MICLYMLTDSGYPDLADKHYAYIGLTIYPRSRLAAHLRDMHRSNSRLRVWLRWLQKQKRKPLFTILDTIEISATFNREATLAERDAIAIVRAVRGNHFVLNDSARKSSYYAAGVK